METRHALRNIKLYYLFQLFLEPLFWGPILILFIQRAGKMSLSDIYVMESVCVIGIMLLEVPSGAIADMLGRRRTVLLGSAIMVIKMIVITSAVNPTMVWVGNILWVIAFTLISGADNSLLYDSLRVLGREDEYKKVEGRSQAYRLALIAVCSAIAGYLAEMNLRLPLILSCGFLLVSVAAAFLFKEPPFTGQERYSVRAHWQLVKVSLLFVANHKQVKWVIAFSILLGTAGKIWFFTYNPYFELVGVKLSDFGLMFCLMNIVAAVFSHEADRFARLLGDFKSVALMIILIAAPMYLMGAYVAPPAVFLVLSQNVVRGYMNPFLGHFLHRHLDSQNRATVMSVKGAAKGLAEFVALGVFGFALGILSLPQSLMALGIFTFVAGICLLLSYCRIFVK